MTEYAFHQILDGRITMYHIKSSTWANLQEQLTLVIGHNYALNRREEYYKVKV